MAYNSVRYMPRSARSERASHSSLASQLIWAALWLILTLGTGTPQATLLSWPKVVNAVAALGFVLFSLMRMVGRTPKGRPVLLFTSMMRAWGTAPVGLWLAALLWIGAFAYSVIQAAMPRLALEKAGEFGWRLLLCALIFGYAAGGWRQLCRVLGGIALTGDIVSLLFCSGLGAWVFFDRAYGVLYAALLLPLAVWHAGRTQPSKRPAAMAHYIWSRARIGLLLLFCAWSQPQATIWAGLGSAWPGVKALVLQNPLNGSGPGTFAFYWPQHMAESVPREPHLLFPGLWAHTAVESGIVAAIGLLLVVAAVTVGGVAKAGEHRSLGIALRVSIALFCVLGLWLSPEGAPALEMTFLALPALTAALRWGPGIGIHNDEAWPHERDAPFLPHSAFSRVVVLFLALAGLVFSLWRVTTAWRQTRAHWIDDQSLRQSDPERQRELLVAAIRDDPAQPAYWVHLAQARLRRDGIEAARTGASYLRLALHRAVPKGEAPDAALWYEIAQLAYQAGDYDRALAMAKRAVQYDPFCCDYRLLLAACYLLHDERDNAEKERKIALRCLKNAPGHPPNRYLRRLKTD